MASYSKLSPAAAEKLRAIVGDGRFQYGETVREEYSHDEMPIYGRFLPEAVCLAESTEEVSAILKICHEENVPVTVRGAGTGLVGGCVPIAGGIVLSTMKMNKILSYDMNNLVVHTQPGVRLCDLAADALAHGLMYPPDPGEKTATVGGNVSTNAGGMRAVKYGVTRDYVLAMTVVLPDGTVMKLGKTVCKTSSGYSLLHLMIGSEGTLGVITELTLKLVPKPRMDVSLILPFRDIATAIASVPAIKLANLDPQSIEFMERDIVDSSAAFTGNAVFPTVVDGKEAGAYILVTLVGDSEAELTAKMDRLGEVAEKTGAYDTLVVWTDGLKKDVWAARSAFLTVIEAETKLLDEMDVVVPVDRIAEFLVYTHDEAERQGVYVRSFGHAGDGNLHIYCCSNDLEEDEFKRRVKRLMDACYAKCTEFEGQVSGEHSIGHAKKAYLRESVGETAYGLMGAIKQVFDPKGILNPGKVCHDAEGGAEHA
jgi:glycolate oxidase